MKWVDFTFSQCRFGSSGAPFSLSLCPGLSFPTLFPYPKVCQWHFHSLLCNKFNILICKDIMHDIAFRRKKERNGCPTIIRECKDRPWTAVNSQNANLTKVTGFGALYRSCLRSEKTWMIESWGHLSSGCYWKVTLALAVCCVLLACFGFPCTMQIFHHVLFSLGNYPSPFLGAAHPETSLIRPDAPIWLVLPISALEGLYFASMYKWELDWIQACGLAV